MSYTNPKFFREDYLAFSRNMERSFDKHFGNTMEHYEDKIAARDEYEKDLLAQADKMRAEATSAENLSTEMQEKIEADIQKFLKEGLAVKDAEGRSIGDKDFKAGFFGQHIKEEKKDALDIDEAQASFKAEIGAINKISDRAFVDNLHVHDDYDRGGETYLEYANVVKALQNNFGAGGSMDVNYAGGNKFGAGITIPNPRWTPKTLEVKENTPGATQNEDGKWVIPNPDWDEDANEGLEENLTYNASQIQALIGENDPEARAAIEENIKAATDTLFNTAKSNLTKRHEYGKSQMKPGDEGKFYSGEWSVEKEVTDWMTEMQATDENDPNAPNVVNDIFNNKVNFNDKIRLEELSKVPGSETLTDLIMENGTVSAKKSDILDQLLDLPHNAISDQKRLLKRLGVTDPNAAMKILEGARNNMVHRYMVNEVIGQGIGSKSISPQQATTTGGGGGGGGDAGGDDIRSSVIATQQSGFQFTEAESKDFTGDDMYNQLSKANLLPRGGGDVGKQSWGEWFRGENKQLSQEEFNKMLNNPEQFAAWKKKIEESGNVDLIEKFSTMSSDIVSGKVPTITGTEIDGKRVQNQSFDPNTGELTIAFDTEGEDIRTYNMNKLSGDLQLYLDQMGYGDKTGKTIEEGTRKFMEEKMPMLIDNRYDSNLGGSDGMYDNYFDASNAGAGMDKIYQDYLRRKSVADYNDINTGLSIVPIGERDKPIAITPEITITPSDGIDAIMKQVDMLADKGQGDIYKKVIEKLAELQNQ